MERKPGTLSTLRGQRLGISSLFVGFLKSFLVNFYNSFGVPFGFTWGDETERKGIKTISLKEEQFSYQLKNKSHNQ